jgi:hypothetical protein
MMFDTFETSTTASAASFLSAVPFTMVAVSATSFTPQHFGAAGDFAFSGLSLLLALVAAEWAFEMNETAM